ncbi:MAG: SUMF1/EgtB/PvdO family nonheme iron enzyme, partial [Gemmatimonadetes bacterium]|nr:SUMF1/EgtB/PvdO family nonheme iron enzyme [Gemmatimonadota bacterium]NIR79573.1 SUMF1/EgtB/PvdO family nonheme iron enzyme [Gemmatimonadota bacterium]NIT88264.1 SUMF1/EgtB/PvdO family nonheme iron enzyme [Gemmatimonadota bacterium]NIU32062.1 SUMF1/EgtB/PvdO family nonheme iron enzyme [Gemmatimonadota bacterium]NIV62437.1 SUMF1/EgtB/PvdO family nonheme iron enzyme [Gemmatimonadota bacterium]
ERERQLPRDEALEIVRQVGAALGFAHAQGVVHRDIKPENILLSRGDAVVADFGIAHALDAAGGERLTQTGMAVGTPVYMSPEQARGPASLDGRSDQYSLACVLYEMLVGAPPFDGPTAQVIFARHSMDPVPPLRSARSTVPAEVETAVERALAKSPADRFPSVDEFVNALEGAAGPDADRAARPGPARFARWVGLRGISAGAVLAVLVLAGAWGWAKQARAGWARTEALPEAARLIQEGRNHAALRLLREAEAAIPGDPVLQELLLESTSLVTVRTTPPGARVSVRDFLGEPDDWEVLGRAPLDDLRLPTADLVWRIEHEGYATRHAVAFTPARTFHFALQPAADAPAQMVYVPGGPFELYSTGVVELEPYWIDRYEVTNRRFRAFVEGGGYARREHRTEPFVRGGGAPPREEAIDRFRDRTGRPGPATWEVSTYPDGEDDRPVVGVSWYEAAAYCASVGKQLPTVHHWYHAAQLGLTTQYAAVSRFSADGPVDVGRPRAMGRFGTYDMAGNAKEWTWNAADAERRYILGGGWDEPAYQFSNPDAQNPFARRPTYGFRCARYDEPLSPALLEPIAAPFRDYREETPVGDDVFAVYQNLYRYDPTPLEARVESVDDELENWRTERVSFAAAYGEERVPALLLLPTDARPPFQTVVYF